LGLISQVTLHFIICFLDAGTIFEDEEDSYKDERTYCVTCSLYRLRGSKHCLYCNRCVRTYDHHCGVFGKCIGRRNLLPFWLFMIITGLEMPTFIILLVTQTFGST
jgi:palmitoyltransferase